jgi:hypothetical protein
MNGAAYRKHLARLSLSQEEAGILFGASPRTGQRWANDGPPLSVAVLLVLVQRFDLTVDDLRKIIDKLQPLDER